ncbi:MAG: sensor histidine kinase [Deltaproteobacteria bacterium]|nr:sensor histidine kinase [Deltaproteobacteria bacterium]
MWTAIGRLLGDTGAARPIGPSPWDRWIALALAPIIVAEALLRDGLALRPLHVAVGFAMLGAVVVRRARPLAATALGFGLATGWSFVLRALGVTPTTLDINAFVLLLPYSLVRWGSAREVVAGVVILAGAYGSAALHGELHGVGEAIGAAVVMLFPGVLGASARFRADAHAREVEHVKLQERAYLARDLHDTVAHHVAAIAIQAQAGRAVLAVRPEASASSLEAIEREAARTLAELRSMVGALREGSEASRSPSRGLADLEALEDLEDLVRDAPTRDGRLAIDIAVEDGLASLTPATQTALYRIAQESITNALRHARGATRVRVRVSHADESVRMTVEDDGTGASQRGSGFGLVGMAERAALLGGRLTAGPRDDGGWSVEVDLPFACSESDER